MKFIVNVDDALRERERGPALKESDMVPSRVRVIRLRVLDPNVMDHVRVPSRDDVLDPENSFEIESVEIVRDSEGVALKRDSKVVLDAVIDLLVSESC